MTGFSTGSDEPDEPDELDELDDLDTDSPPYLIDAGIERLASRLNEGDVATLLTFAQLCWLRYVQTVERGQQGQRDDLDQALAAYRRVLPSLRVDPDRPELLVWSLSLYGDILQARDAAEADGGTDLDEAIDVTVEAIDRALAAEPELLQRLGDRYVERYARLGRESDFDAGERALDASLAVPGQEPADRVSAWMRLGLLYHTRFTASGDSADRDRSIQVLRYGWYEGSGNQLLAMSYLDTLIDRGRFARTADLDEARRVLDAVGVDELPVPFQPSYFYYQMQERFGRYVGAARDERAADLLAAAEAAGRLIDHPATPAELRAEARVVRATSVLDRAFLTRNLMAEIDGVIDDLEDVGQQINPGLRLVAEVQLTTALTERARRTSEPEDIDRALAFGYDVLTRLPHGTRNWSRVCYLVACLLMYQVEAGRAKPGSVDRVVDLLRAVVNLGDTERSVRPVAITQLATAIGARLYFVGGDLTELDKTLRYADEGLRAIDLDDPNRPATVAGLATALMLRYELRGDLADLHWCIALLTDLRDEVPGDPNRPEIAWNLAQAQIAWSAATGDGPSQTVLETVATALVDMTPRNGKRPQVLRSLAGGYAVRAHQTQDSEDWRAAARYARLCLDRTPVGAPFAGQLRSSAGGVLWLAGRALGDAELVQEATQLLDTAMADPASEAVRIRLLGMYAEALLHRHENASQTGAANRAVAALQEATARSSADPGVRGAAELHVALAQALAVTGDAAGSAEAGRRALRAYAWQVLLQSGTHDAMTAARQSATDALALARLALRAGDRRRAVMALETGRGLVLHAATVAASVPDLLLEAGHPGLADEWIAAGPRPPTGDEWRVGIPSIPSHLRFRVLTALEQSPLLLDPPSPEALSGALTALGADCLVYLFPGTADESGLALTCEAGGNIYSIDLPALTGAWSVPSAIQAVLARDVGVNHGVGDEIGRDLAELCGAAWDAAIEPLLDHWYARHHHQPHIVIVPSGSLATVPWHAAHGSRRWAIDEATFSYIASGRLLVDVSRRTTRVPDRAALVIGNPPTGEPGQDLAGAAIEASTIFQRHYDQGRYCGSPAGPDIVASGHGTPQDILGWLDGTGEPPCPVLHLACHGKVRVAGPASSSLLLAHGTTVSAEDILNAARRRRADYSPGLVSLAACTTHTAGRAYDEAVTLSTAFLVAGASTAIGSVWPVPDGETARLMVAFHDNLASRGLPPASALRAAQRDMRDSAGTTLAGWAGFVHLGH